VRPVCPPPLVRAELRRRDGPGPRELERARDACARAVLARATGTRDGEWRLARGGSGRPLASHPDWGDVGLSVAHTADVVACAACADAAVGVDVEPVRPSEDVDAIRREMFDSALNRRLDALPAAARVDAFYEAWVAFEALGKVSGRGIVDWRCPDLDATGDPEALAACCGADRPTYLWRGRRGPLAWAVAVATASARPLLAWRWLDG